jgi:serine/threonine protein phosphatase PrpC
LPKQLRLEVAELTDVGRRRDSNEDNLTRLVPKDQKILEQKGAIFVVADGMGGHAAGEVASEIAVETIREEYYESEQEGTPETIAYAIKQANQVIYDRATEQAGRAGMGTTCVVAVVRGALVYLANVGDSRAYLVRDGQIRQLTHDHSWVAEQVRAGMLTDEQARTHAHRNVITRALGTQPEIQPDLFIQPLQDGDLLLLCTDGLSGCVSDEEINRILNSTSLQEGVRTLIAQANEQGGPDNITAVLVRVVEVPPLSPEAREHIEALVEPDKTPLPAPNGPAKRRKKKLTPLQWAMRFFTVVAVVFLVLVALDYAVGPLAWGREAQNQLNADLERANTLLAQAQEQEAAEAINTLAAAQHPLISDVNNARLSAADRQRASDALQHVLAPAIRKALQRYNALALVEPLSTLKPQQWAISCPAVPAGKIDEVLAMPGAQPSQGNTTQHGPVALYARAQMGTGTGNSALYPLTLQPDDRTLACGTQLLDAIIDVTTDGTALSVLRRTGPDTFTVQAISSAGSLSPALTLPVEPQNTMPTLLAVHNGLLYVLYRGATGTADTLYQCQNTAPVRCRAYGPPALPAQARSLSVGADGVVYLLLVDGSLGVLTGEGLHAANLTLQPALPVADPETFNPLTPLPQVPVTPVFPSAPAKTPGSTPTEPAPTATSGVPAPTSISATSPTPTATPGPYTPQGVKLLNATMLASDQQAHLFIADGADHRVIRLHASADDVGDPSPDQQYADPSVLDNLLSVTAVASEQGVSLYLLSGQSVLAIALP